mgnify:CR=1 FL=1
MEQQDWNQVTWSKNPARINIYNTVNAPGIQKVTHKPTQLPKGHAKFKQLDSDDPLSVSASNEINPITRLKIRQSIQKARLAKSLTQKDLAGKLRINVKIINEYESGKVVPDKTMISKICRVLGVSSLDRNGGA